MNTPRRLLAFLLALVMVLTMHAIVFAAESEDAEGRIRQMLDYYVRYQDAAGTDYERLCRGLEDSDPALAEVWTDIIGYLNWADSDMEVTPDILPDGLPEDDSLCIVVLGYALKSNGSMRDELIGRLEVALASAQKYPNAYILCTGGGTASRSKTKTEAGQMAAWLAKQGIAEDRIIIENESLNTIQNAQFSCSILEESYPQVRHIAMVSSDYHVPWASVFFHTEFALSAYASGAEPLEMAGYAGFRTSNDNTVSASYLATGVAQLAGMDYESPSKKPALSKLTHLEVSGDFTYEAGTAMSLTATAHYDTGYSKDVTSAAVFSGVDMNQSGEQLLTVTYEENGIEVISRLLIDVVSNSIIEEVEEEIIVIAPTETLPDTDTIAAELPSLPPMLPFLLLAALLAVLAALLWLKIVNNRK